ncbi:hypothetical protein VIGAN_01489900, partial [Vigna angularis var. angularis]
FMLKVTLEYNLFFFTTCNTTSFNSLAAKDFLLTNDVVTDFPVSDGASADFRSVLSNIAAAGSNFDLQSDSYLVVAATSFKDLTAARDNKIIGSDFILQFILILMKNLLLTKLLKSTRILC